MPQVVTVRVDRRNGRRIRMWVPVIPVVVVLAPIVGLAVLAAAVACHVYRVDAAHALGTGWRIVTALPGTRFEIGQGRTAVLVIIR